jgi:hypothetical protein
MCPFCIPGSFFLSFDSQKRTRLSDGQGLNAYYTIIGFLSITFFLHHNCNVTRVLV